MTVAYGVLVNLPPSPFSSLQDNKIEVSDVELHVESLRTHSKNTVEKYIFQNPYIPILLMEK